MQTIYYNGDFLSFENQEIEAILVQDDRIKKIGKKEEIFSLQNQDTKKINLCGNTMMPAFIDSHSHFMAVANQYLQVSLKNCSTIKQIQDQLLNYQIQNHLPNDRWIIANGFDSYRLEGHTKLRKEQIDEVLPNHPVLIHNQSGHSGILNTKALKLLNIDSHTVPPAGGKIEKINQELTGYLEENAFIETLKKVPMPPLVDILKAVKQAEQEYFSYGITTVQEGFLSKELLDIYQEIVKENQLQIDIIAYIDKTILEEVKSKFPKNIKQYQNHFKIGGIKIFLDGSPQDRTAWMRTPYEKSTDYFGYGTMQDKQVEESIFIARKEQMQILAHCNGDRAVEQYMEMMQKVEKTGSILRPVLIHGQLLGLDQLKQIKKLGIIPSFFVAHVYYFGEVHIENFGLARAERISPAKSSLDNNILFTFHQDAPVIKPNMLETIWCAVNRITKGGIKLGKEEAIDVINAIKAVTINSAYQYFEEDSKGSIAEGKKADLIILNQNPFKVKKEELKTIQVLETIKNGKTVYQIENKNSNKIKNISYK